MSWSDDMMYVVGHLFCNHCLIAALRAGAHGGGTCPSCRASLDDKDAARPAVIMRRLIDGKRVKCLFAIPIPSVAAPVAIAAGSADHDLEAPPTPTSAPSPPLECKWQGRRGDIKAHIDGSCPLARVGCDRCGDILRRSELADHTSVCRRRLIACEHCETKIAIDETTDHLSRCVQLPVQCPNDCKSINLRRSDLINHMNDCPMIAIPCPYESRGCPIRMTRDQMKLHVNDPIAIQNHLQITNGQLSLSITQITHLTETNRRLITECERLSEEVKHQREAMITLADQNRTVIAVVQELIGKSNITAPQKAGFLVCQHPNLRPTYSL
jgi:hypothetical protein